MGREKRGLQRVAPARSKNIASVYKEIQMGMHKGNRVRWSTLGSRLLPGNSQSSTSFNKDEKAEIPQARSGHWAVLVATTHLTVLRDLHLLPLRHLGDVEVTLWDPQREKTTRSIRRKSKLEETRNAFRKFCS